MPFIIGIAAMLVVIFVLGALAGYDMGYKKALRVIIEKRLAAIDEEPRRQGNGVLMGP